MENEKRPARRGRDQGRERPGRPRVGLAVRATYTVRRGCLLASFAVAACGPRLERTPPVTGRDDATVARAEVATWKVGDMWSYHGKTFDSADNRFYLRVVREAQEGTRRLYEVDTPRYLVMYDAETLRPVRERHKASGGVSGAVSHNPLFFPLSISRRYSTWGTWAHEWGDPLELFRETCVVVNYEDVEVPAGKFAAFRIECKTNDGFAEHWYAPAVKNLVKMRWMGDRSSFGAELWNYHLAQ
jgi:hypothetical protein